MRFRLKCALSLAKSRSRGWVQIKCSLAGQHLENCWLTGEHCCRAVMFESGKIRRENCWSRILKVCFCNFDCFHTKANMVKSRSRGWVQIKCYPAGQHLKKFLTNRWTLLSRCPVWERENSARKLLVAHTKSLVLQFWMLSFKNKNGASKETFCSSYRRWNWRTCRKRLHEHSKHHMDCCTFVSPLSFL